MERCYILLDFCSSSDKRRSFARNNYNQLGRKNYGSLVWESEPLPSEVNRWTIKLKWEIWYYPQGQPSQKRYVFETNTHVIYATVGEPLSCGIEDYKSPWYTILDRATEWAAGRTSAADAMEAITRKVYDMPLFDYSGDTEWSLLRPFAWWGSNNIELNNNASGGNHLDDP